MLDTNASRPTPPAVIAVGPNPPLPGLLELEELARRAERRYIDVVASILIRDLPETSPHLVNRWEAVLNARVAVVRTLRADLQRARVLGSRWPASLTRSLEGCRRRLQELEREERELVSLGLYEELGGG